MSFAQILDQDIPIRLLRNCILRGRIPSGLLFWGPQGVGKRLAAMEFAMALNCTGARGEACGACLSCRKAAHGNHPDLKEIVPAGATRIIKVDVVTEMNEMATFRPYEGGWRIFLIHDADRMNEAAQNHFLKTLEEPPSKTLFILITEYPRALLPTIRSRCQQVRFGALRPETVTSLILRDRDLPASVAEAVAAVSQGQMSRALDLMDTGRRDLVLDLVHRLSLGEDPMLISQEFSSHIKARREAIKAAVLAEQAEQGAPVDQTKEDKEAQEEALEAHVKGLIRRDLMEYLYLFGTWYRDVLVFHSAGGVDAVLNRDQADRLDTRANDAPDGKLAAIERAWVYIERNLNLDRVFRDLFFAFAPGARAPE